MAWDDIQTDLDNVTAAEWNAMVSAIKSGSVIQHSGLLNLSWSTAGHTIDTSLDMNENYIHSIKYADAYSNTLPGLFTQHSRDASIWDFYSAFHSYIPTSVAASQTHHRLFGISSQIKTEGLAHLVYADTTLNGAIDDSVTTITIVSTTGFDASGSIQIEKEWISYTGKTATTFTGCTRGQEGTIAIAHANGITVINGFTHSVALFGSVVSGKLPGDQSCQIWGANTLVESQYDSIALKGFEQHMQGYENDVNRALPHVMKEDGGVLYTNYYSSGDKGTVLNNATDILVALNHCIGFNATGINTGNPGIAYNVAGGGTAYWNVGVMLDYPFQYAAIIMGDAQKVMWKNGTSGNYEERLRNSAADFHITAGSGGNIVLNNEVNMWANKIVSLAEPAIDSDAATKYYVDNVLGASYQLISEKDSASGYAALDANGNVVAPGSGLGLTEDAGDNMSIYERVTGYQSILMTRFPATGAHYFKAYINRGTTTDIWDEIQTLSDVNNKISTHAALSTSVHGVSASGFQDKDEKDVANGYVGYNSALDIDGKGSGIGLTPDSNNIFIGENTNDAQVLLMTNSPGIGTHYFKAYLNKGTTGNIWDEIITLSSSAILSSAQKTDLTDAGESTLHYHSSDRNLANATGTLADSNIASTIARDSEVSTAVSNHVSAYGHLSTAQKTDLTDGGNSARHYHTTDRALANATGILADGNIASTIARDSEVSSAISTHASNADAHHPRYTFASNIIFNFANPAIQFASTDYLQYDTTNNRLNVIIGGTIRAYCDSTGWH